MNVTTEIRTEISHHPELGDLTKQVKYTWDSDRFATLDEAIAFVNPDNLKEKGYMNREHYTGD